MKIEIETSTGRQLVWVLIDLDASCTIGSLAGQKVTSSAFYPPEMARQELMKQAPPTHATDLAATVAEKKTQLDAAMQRRENEAVSSLTLELKQLEAELKHVGPGSTGELDPIKASIQFEMWYLGCLLYQVQLRYTMYHSCIGNSNTNNEIAVWQAMQGNNASNVLHS